MSSFEKIYKAITKDYIEEIDDDGIMKMYVKHAMNGFPCQRTMDVLNTVMKNRNITPKNMSLSFTFEVDGRDKIISANV